MKFVLSILILVSFTATAQVYKSPADADVKAANKDSMLFIPANLPLPDTLPKSIWKTTISKDKIADFMILMVKDDGSIMIIDSAWRMNFRKEGDRVAIIYPDSSRVFYRFINKLPDSIDNITIPFTINKKRFDEMQSIKLEIIR